MMAVVALITLVVMLVLLVVVFCAPQARNQILTLWRINVRRHLSMVEACKAVQAQYAKYELCGYQAAGSGLGPGSS